MKIIKKALIMCAMILISGCTNNSEMIKTTPNIEMSPTPTPTATSNADKESFELEYIEPLLNENIDGYMSYNIFSDYYNVCDSDMYYGVINENKEIVLKPCSKSLPSTYNGNQIIYFSDLGSSNQKDIQNSDLKVMNTENYINFKVVYDLDTNEIKIMGLVASDMGQDVTSDFDSTLFNDKSLMAYEEVYSEETTVEGFSATVYQYTYKKGVTNNNGELITKAIYDDVFNINSELIPVKKDDLWGYVDNLGVEVIPCMYRSTFGGLGSYNEQLQEEEQKYPYPVIDGRIVVKNQDEKYGVIDTKGNTLIEFEYDYGSPYYDNSVILKKEGEWIVK